MGNCCTVDFTEDTTHPLTLDAQRVFYLIDTDLSGKISTAELSSSTSWAEWKATAASAPPSPPPSEWTLADFSRYITSLSYIDAVVLLDCMERELVTRPIEKMGEEVFTLLDTNANGEIDLHDEASALSGFSGKLVLAEMDFDRNGAVDRTEFMRALRSKAIQSPLRIKLILSRAKDFLLAEQKKRARANAQAFLAGGGTGAATADEGGGAAAGDAASGESTDRPSRGAAGRMSSADLPWPPPPPQMSNRSSSSRRADSSGRTSSADLPWPPPPPPVAKRSLKLDMASATGGGGTGTSPFHVPSLGGMLGGQNASRQMEPQPDDQHLFES